MGDACGIGITQKTETLRDPITAETSTHVYQYTFDPAGQLTAVTLDGAPWESYAYDANGNRTSWTDPWGSGAAAYDAQDRLLTAGSLTYTYTANGELLTRSQNGQTDTFGYDAMGTLRSVTLASGVQITYLIDGLNRRAGTVVNGVQASGLLYGNGAQPLAQLDGAGHVVATYLYGTGNAPDAILQDGVTYRLLKDHLGSVRWVINALTGEVAEHLDYDAFGRVILDTNPGFQPFGFAGGLYDPQTGLVHFGARDYDPTTGRWVSKDPIGFDGGSTGLYVYVGNDPVNDVDIDGTAGQRDKDYCDDVVTDTAGGMIRDMLRGRPQAHPGIAVPTAMIWWGLGHAACAMAFPHELTTDEAIQLGVGTALGMGTPGLRFGGLGATATVKEGTRVYRAWGGDAGPWGKSWTTIDPGTVSGYRNLAGLPTENTGRFLSEGLLRYTNGTSLRSSFPLDGNAGGLLELVVRNPKSQVLLLNVQEINPDF